MNSFNSRRSKLMKHNRLGSGVEFCLMQKPLLHSTHETIYDALLEKLSIGAHATNLEAEINSIFRLFPATDIFAVSILV